MERSSEEMQNICVYFIECFKRWLSAVEGPDKELHSTAADMEGKVCDKSKLCFLKTPKARSMGKKTSGQDLPFSKMFDSDHRRKEPNLSNNQAKAHSTCV